MLRPAHSARALLLLLARSLTHSRPHGEVNDKTSQNYLVLSLSEEEEDEDEEEEEEEEEQMGHARAKKGEQ